MSAVTFWLQDATVARKVAPSTCRTDLNFRRCDLTSGSPSQSLERSPNITLGFLGILPCNLSPKSLDHPTLQDFGWRNAFAIFRRSNSAVQASAKNWGPDGEKGQQVEDLLIWSCKNSSRDIYALSIKAHQCEYPDDSICFDMFWSLCPPLSQPWIGNGLDLKLEGWFQGFGQNPGFYLFRGS